MAASLKHSAAPRNQRTDTVANCLFEHVKGRPLLGLSWQWRRKSLVCQTLPGQPLPPEPRNRGCGEDCHTRKRAATMSGSGTSAPQWSWHSASVHARCHILNKPSGHLQTHRKIGGGFLELKDPWMNGNASEPTEVPSPLCLHHPPAPASQL